MLFPRIENIPHELIEIAQNVARISGSLNPVEIYTADQDSISRERQKVFDANDSHQEYNPQLTYSYAKSLLIVDTQRLLRLEKKKLSLIGNKIILDKTSNLFRMALFHKIKDDLATCDLVDGIQNENEQLIEAALNQKYPGTDQNLCDLAVSEFVKITHDKNSSQEALGKDALITNGQYEWLKQKKVSVLQQEEAFKWVLSQYGILKNSENGKGFYVVATYDATSIDVRDKSKYGPTIFLPLERPTSMTMDKLLLLLAHEIEGHARQSINGEDLYLLGGGRLKVDNEELYEGLALRYEMGLAKRLFGQKSLIPSPFYVFAVKMAEEGASFYKIFSDQLERLQRVGFKQVELKNRAWQITYRVMRGHIDMSNKNKFAMAKDLGYLRGYIMDQQLQENGLGIINEEGIISSGGLPLLAELNHSPEKLPISFRDITTMYFNEVLLPQMPIEIRGDPLPLAA